MVLGPSPGCRPKVETCASSRRGARTPLKPCRGSLEQVSAFLNARIGSCASSKGPRAPPPPPPPPQLDVLTSKVKP